MMEFALIFLIAVHLLAVNLAGAGPLLAMLVEWRGTANGSPQQVEAARRLAVWSIVAGALGMAIGLVTLWVLVVHEGGEQSRYWAAVKQVTPGRLGFTGAEIVFYFVCMGLYVGLWRRMSRIRWAHRVLAIAAATNLLYHFPALFTILAILPTRPELAGQMLDRKLYLKLLLDGETLSRVAHVWLASLSVAGVALGWLAHRIEAATRDPSATDPHTDETTGARKAGLFGWRVALGATTLQIPVGAWVLTMLPSSAQDQVMGDNLICSGLFVLSIVGALALMHQLAMLALGDIQRGRIRIAAALIAGVVLLMTATLQLMRTG